MICLVARYLPGLCNMSIAGCGLYLPEPFGGSRKNL